MMPRAAVAPSRESAATADVTPATILSRES